MTTRLSEAVARTAGPVAGPIRGRALGILVLFLITHVLLAWLAREPGVLTGADDARYIALAQSLRDLGYNELYRAGEPIHSQYPPGYPAMLAVWGLVFGDGFDSLTALTMILSAASLVLVFLLVRRVLGEKLALLAVMILAVNPYMISFAGAVMSEMPYIFMTVLALFYLQRDRPGKWNLVVAGAIALAAALTRSAGVTFVAAIVAVWLVERRYRAAIVFSGASGLVLGAWFLWTMLAPEQYVGASYVADITAAGDARHVNAFPWRIPKNIAFYGRTGVPWALAVPTIPGTPVDNAFSILILTVTVSGGLLVFLRRWRTGLLYFAAYGILLAVWVWQVDRFIVPVLFLIVAAVLGGANAIGSRLGERWGLRAAGALAAILLFGGIARSAPLVAERWRCGESLDGLPPAACIQSDQASFFDAVRWVRANTEPDAVLLAAKASAMWHYTGRQHVSYRAALAQPPTEFLAYLREQDTDYILLGSLQHRELDDLVERVAANCSELTVAAFFPARTWLFSLRAPDSADAAEASCAAVTEYRNLNQGRSFRFDR